MQLTPNFKLSEFQCGSETPTNAIIVNVKMLAIQLQKVRDAIGSPINIVQGLCAYPDGRTANIKSNNVSNYQLAQKIIELMNAGEMVKGNVTLYDSFVTVDILGKQTFSDKRTNTNTGGNTNTTNPGTTTYPQQKESNLSLYVLGAVAIVLVGIAVKELA